MFLTPSLTIFWGENFWSKFLVQKNLDRKNWVKENFWVKKKLGNKHFLVEKKNFGQKKFLGKKFGVK